MHRSMLSAVLVVAFAAAAHAAPLTCTMFRERLDGALLATGQTVDALAFKPGFNSPERGARYDFTSGSLSGTLTCGLADEFREFGIEMHLRSGDNLAGNLKQLMTTQGGSLCALTSSTAPDCTEYGRGLLENVLAQMGSAYNHGVQHPSGLSEKTLFGTLHVTLTSAPTLVTFLVGTDAGTTFDAARQPLPAPAPQPAPAPPQLPEVQPQGQQSPAPPPAQPPG